MNTTLLLDVGQWDVVLDAAGNLAIASPPYASAQDVASAIRLFAGELWYDQSKGIPYFQEILGESPPLSLFQAYLVAAAMTVPNVVSALCEITQIENRRIDGQVTFTLDNGTIGSVSL